MYKKIMVPLDGSKLAECVLPHLETFIKDYHIDKVVLVRVMERESSFPGAGEVSIDPKILAERESARKSSAMEYLTEVADQLKHEGTEIEKEVITGRVTESLIDYAEKNDVDLILIATHGRSGVTRWVRGSVADKLLRSSSIPILMVRAPGTEGGI